MVSCSKVSETLQQQVVQTKVNSSHSKKSWSFQIWDFENIASLQCHKLIQVPPKGWASTKTNAQEDKIIQRISVSSWFNIAAGIARQFGAEQGKDLSWHIVSRRWTESPLPLISRKNQKAACKLVQSSLQWWKHGSFIWIRWETLCLST